MLEKRSRSLYTTIAAIFIIIYLYSHVRNLAMEDYLYGATGIFATDSTGAASTGFAVVS